MTTAILQPTVIQLQQGSPQWLEYRLKMRNASETAAVLGLSPFCTPYQLWLLKTGRETAKTNAAMAHGTQMEPVARAAYEGHSGNLVQPLVMQSGLYSASLDGITLDWDRIVEIKCPYRGRDSELWKQAELGQLPEHYWYQVQHQLMVSGATQADFWVFDGEGGLTVSVEPDQAAMERIEAGWDGFQGYLDRDAPPPLSDADTVLRADAAWAEAAGQFAAAKQRAEEAEKALASAREALVALAQHPREHGAGVSVTRFWKAGAVDYKKVPELQGINLDHFRGKSRVEIRVSTGL